MNPEEKLREAERIHDLLLKNYNQLIHEIQSHSSLRYRGEKNTDRMLIDIYDHPPEEEDEKLEETVEKTVEKWEELQPLVNELEEEIDREHELHDEHRELKQSFNTLDNELKNMNKLEEAIGSSPLSHRDNQQPRPETDRNPAVEIKEKETDNKNQQKKQQP
ncbi:MAG: hypothetical protein ABEJ36_02050 [Candidatus Nanosalina sp.]